MNKSQLDSFTEFPIWIQELRGRENQLAKVKSQNNSVEMTVLNSIQVIGLLTVPPPISRDVQCSRLAIFPCVSICIPTQVTVINLNINPKNHGID